MKSQSGRSFTVTVLLLSLHLCRGQRKDNRPSCARCDRHLSCNCSHIGFTRVPMVTGRALTLDLSFNNITMVTDDDLSGHQQLRALDLHGNGLASIHPSALDSLWSLEELDLSDNQLTALNHSWFGHLGALQKLNLLNNPYSCLGPAPLFGGLVRLRTLAFGGPALEELRRGDLCGVSQLDQLTVHANNLDRYESGSLANIWPLGRVTLNLHGPILTNVPLASAVLLDVSYPETPVTLEDVYLVRNQSVQGFREVIKKRLRHISFRNLSLSDEAAVALLMLLDGMPLTSIRFEGLTLMGDGRWQPGSSLAAEILT